MEMMFQYIIHIAVYGYRDAPFPGIPYNRFYAGMVLGLDKHIFGIFCGRIRRMEEIVTVVVTCFTGFISACNSYTYFFRWNTFPDCFTHSPSVADGTTDKQDGYYCDSRQYDT